MTMVSLIAGCLVSSSPPSRRVVLVGSMLRMVLRFWIWWCRCSGGV